MKSLGTFAFLLLAVVVSFTSGFGNSARTTSYSCGATGMRSSVELKSKSSSGDAAAHSDDDDENEVDPAFKYYNRDEEEKKLVTREMLLRDMLEDPKVKRKKNKKNGSYKTLDNRDSLPFVVKTITPDPYTPLEIKEKEARRNTQRDRQKNKGKTKRRMDLTLGKATYGIAASIYSEGDDGSLHRVIGEFHLDKNTNCGDVLEVGDQEFEVLKARCQYKYAGGKRFVMTRKILEVKEITRIAEENYLHRQFQKGDMPQEDDPPQLE